MSYVDYAEGLEDLLAMCLTGFPGFESHLHNGVRLVYVGPDADARGPALFTADRVRELARTAGVQVNVVLTGADNGTLAALARDTGGRALPADADVPAHLADIRANPPAAVPTARHRAAKPTESPDVPLAVALLAALVLAAWPVVRR